MTVGKKYLTIKNFRKIFSDGRIIYVTRHTVIHKPYGENKQLFCPEDLCSQDLSFYTERETEVENVMKN